MLHGLRAVSLLITLTALLMIGGLAPPTIALAQEATPAATCAETTPEENLAVLQRFFAGVNSADLSLFDEVVAPDVIYHGATVGDETGLEALKRIYGEALTGFPGIQYTLLTSTTGPDAVAARYQASGVHSGEFRGLAPTGNPITWTHSTFAHVACGKIVEMWAEVSQLDRLRQFGALATEGPAPILAGENSSAATPVAAAATAQCAPASPEELIAVADRVREEVYNEADLDAMPEIFAAGYLHGSANGPDAVGIEQGGRRIATFLTAFPDLEWQFDEVVAEGDRVSARWTVRGTHNGDLAGFAPTGKPIEMTGISHFTIRCGKVVEFQTEMDAAGMLQQVGAPVTRG